VLAPTATLFWESMNWPPSFILYAWAPVDVCLAYSTSSVNYF
jgi:endonuclease/exonuclease/phosphatase family metal-dependent hydrolase